MSLVISVLSSLSSSSVAMWVNIGFTADIASDTLFTSQCISHNFKWLQCGGN